LMPDCKFQNLSKFGENILELLKLTCAHALGASFTPFLNYY
jgi:hypothetical protein